MTSNLTTTTELREMLAVVDALESVEMGNVTMESVIFSDVNGEPLATYTFIGDFGTYGFVFDGQEGPSE